jgi:hypothetical protein
MSSPAPSTSATLTGAASVLTKADIACLITRTHYRFNILQRDEEIHGDAAKKVWKKEMCQYAVSNFFFLNSFYI